MIGDLMTGTAWVFPGQGSQFVGMGRDLYGSSTEARQVFDAADETLGYNLSRLCFDGPEPELTDTVNAQPAILAHSIATLEALKEKLGSILTRPAFTAGHSLGEYSALVAAGALEFEEALRLVRARGVAMKHAGDSQPGGMAAILGLDAGKVTKVCQEAGSVQIANLNAPGQIVISGEKESLDRAVALAKSAGAKRAIPLAVSIAAHSELMRFAAAEYDAAVVQVPLHPPQVPVVSNVTARILEDEGAIRREMIAQLTSPVQWVKSIEYMRSSGVQQFVEIGPKEVLAGLIRRIVPEAQVLSLGSASAIGALREGTLA
jgi:[acyl-carrier-protein] S-malonyltransferase